MNNILIPPKKIALAQIKGKGRGVIAVEPIKKGELIEAAPLIILNEYDKKCILNKKSVLHYYYFEQLKLQRHCIMLGYASLYNHSNTPNADWEYDLNSEVQIMKIIALKPIEKDEEITVLYDPDEEVLFLPKDIYSQQ